MKRVVDSIVESVARTSVTLEVLSLPHLNPEVVATVQRNTAYGLQIR